MNKKRRSIWIFILYFLLIFFGMNACTNDLSAITPEKTLSDTPIGSPELTIEDTPSPMSVSSMDVTDLSERSPITIQTIEDIVEMARIVPYSPKYYYVSSNGRIAAVGSSQGIQVFEIHSKKLLMEIPIKMPNCEFGKSHPIQLNYDGSFIAITGSDFVQVWQVGGGIVYEQTGLGYRDNSDDICEMDIPEVSVSPNGKLLVLAGFEHQSRSPAAFFHVIGIPEKEIIYEWEGEADRAHGWIYNFPNLGFSSDGKIFQTFDPTRFVFSNGSLHEAFRFWDTSDWSDIREDHESIRESVPPGSLMFGLSEKQTLVVKSRLDGRLFSTINPAPCDFDKPCTGKFTTDGKKAVVFSQQKYSVNYRNNRYVNRLDIYNLAGNHMESPVTGFFRNLDSVYTTESGGPDIFSLDESELKETWWTYPDYFSGLIENGKGEILFSPIQNVCAEDEICEIALTCFLPPDSAEVDCRADYISDNGTLLSPQFDEDKVLLIEQKNDTQNIVGEIDVGIGFDPFTDRLRLLGYSDVNQVGFYCLDKSYRQHSCVILDFSTDSIIQEMDDISFLRFSPDGRYAAFIDKSEKRLNIMDLSSRKITTKTPYQARAYSVNPVFIDEGELLYIVQDNEISDQFAVEYIDLASLKILGRKNLDMGSTIPTTFSSDKSNSIWIVGNDEGWIRIFEAETGKSLHDWQVDEEPLVGLILSHDENSLVAMDETGAVSFYGVIK